MKIVVTGGAGFIGSQLVERLLFQGHQVIVLDNLVRGLREYVDPRADFYRVDICRFEEVQKILSEHRPDIIFHLAAQIDVRASILDPLKDAEINAQASIHLIELARRLQVKKFIFASSGGAIYSARGVRPTPEDGPALPTSPYGINKLMVDHYLCYLAEVFGFEFVSLRYANVYGPRQKTSGEGGVVSIFLAQMLENKAPLIYGNGLQTRDFVYVEDVVEANMLALESEVTGLFNIGSGVEISINRLFAETNQLFDNHFSPRYTTARPGEQEASCLDSRKARQDLHWSSQFSLREGLKKTLSWIQQTG